MTTNEIDKADALVILTKIKAFHSPQNDDDATCEAWADALNYGGVTNIRDAVTSVMRHYGTRGANPWITPGDVIGGYREIRNARFRGIQDSDLTEDVDPDDIPAYLATLRYRNAAIADGSSLEQAQALPLPPTAAHALVNRAERPVLLARER